MYMNVYYMWPHIYDNLCTVPVHLVPGTCAHTYMYMYMYIHTCMYVARVYTIMNVHVHIEGTCTHDVVCMYYVLHVYYIHTFMMHGFYQ